MARHRNEKGNQAEAAQGRTTQAATSAANEKATLATGGHASVKKGSCCTGAEASPAPNPPATKFASAGPRPDNYGRGRNHELKAHRILLEAAGEGVDRKRSQHNDKNAALRAPCDRVCCAAMLEIERPARRYSPLTAMAMSDLDQRSPSCEASCELRATCDIEQSAAQVQRWLRGPPVQVFRCYTAASPRSLTGSVSGGGKFIAHALRLSSPS